MVLRLSKQGSSPANLQPASERVWIRSGRFPGWRNEFVAAYWWRSRITQRCAMIAARVAARWCTTVRADYGASSSRVNFVAAEIEERELRGDVSVLLGLATRWKLNGWKKPSLMISMSKQR